MKGIVHGLLDVSETHHIQAFGGQLIPLGFHFLRVSLIDSLPPHSLTTLSLHQPIPKGTETSSIHFPPNHGHNESA